MRKPVQDSPTHQRMRIASRPLDDNRADKDAPVDNLPTMTDSQLINYLIDVSRFDGLYDYMQGAGFSRSYREDVDAARKEALRRLTTIETKDA